MMAMMMALPVAAGATSASPDVPVCTPSTISVVTSYSAHTTVLYQTFFTGPTNGSTATEEASGTTSYSVTSSVSGSSDLIFASIQASVSGTVQKSVTMSYGSTYGIPNLARGVTLYVAYISRYYASAGNIEDQLATCATKVVGSWTATTPTVDGWVQSNSIITNT
jgi:hypothetical protein